MKTELFIGTAGWSYKDWIKKFYPRGESSDFGWLNFYSNYFNCAEVNSTFYAYASPRSAANWVEKTADRENFQFTVKLHQDFTHKREYDKAKISATKEVFKILSGSGKFGGLLMQFPYSFFLNDVSANLLRELSEIFYEYDKFFEARNSSWRTIKSIELLKKLDLNFCSIDQPQIGKALEFEPIITGDKAYFRFHGKNEEGWKTSISNYGKNQSYAQRNERYNYLYAPGELIEIDKKIKEVFDKVKKIFVIMNNHPQGNAVANAFEITHLLREKILLDIPKTTKQAFNRLERISQKETRFSDDQLQLRL